MEYQNELLQMREQLMSDIDNIVDDLLPYEEALRDQLVTRLCDAVCERIDPVGWE